MQFVITDAHEGREPDMYPIEPSLGLQVDDEGDVCLRVGGYEGLVYVAADILTWVD